MLLRMEILFISDSMSAKARNDQYSIILGSVYTIYLYLFMILKIRSLFMVICDRLVPIYNKNE